MAQMNLFTEKKIMDVENRLVVAKGKGEGRVWLGSLRLTDINCCLWNGAINEILLYSTGNYV